MFGTLDYRASKFYWLFSRPIVLSTYVIAYALIAASVVWSVNYFDVWWSRLGGAILAMEAATILLQLIVAVVMWFFNKIFFFIFDIVPSEGRDIDWAMEVVKKGQILRLDYKLGFDPANFDDRDEQEIACRMERAQGLLVRVLRLFLGVGSGSPFSGSISHRVSVMAEMARERAPLLEGEFISGTEFIDALASENLTVKPLEAFLSNFTYRNMVYRYLFFAIIFIWYLQLHG